MLALPGIVLAFASLLPYLNKAYTIDDPWFLLEARQILKTPLQPMAYDICWMGDVCVHSAASIGPGAAQSLMGYLLVPVILLGAAEWLAHSLQLIFVCLAVLGMVKLALRLGCGGMEAAMAGTLMVAIPPFLPMASTAMPDIVALTLGLTGLERLLAWRSERKLHQAVIASIALGLAPYARPYLALMLPLAALFVLDEFPTGGVRRTIEQIRRDSGVLAPIAIAACLLTAINAITFQRAPAVEPGYSLMFYGRTVPNLFAYCVYLSFPIPLALVWICASARKKPLRLIAPVLATLIPHFLLHSSMAEDWSKTAAVYGLTALGSMCLDYWRERDRIGVLLSLWILMPVPAVIYSHLPLKYMLGVFPAIVLILIRTLGKFPRTRAAAMAGGLVAICTGFSFLILRADADLAEYGRRAAAELIAPHVAAGETVWYGGQWGFYWYAQLDGAKVAKPGGPGPKPGDLLAVGIMETGQLTRNRFPNRELIDSRAYDSPHGRTMGAGAGLYSNGYGYTPWVWDPTLTNVYQLWRIH